MPPPLQLGLGMGLAKAGGPSLDPDAAAYALERSLDDATTARLSQFLKTTKAVGFEPVWLAVGHPDFNALDGTTFHVVIGGDGTLTGSFTESATGLEFAGGAEVFEFPNPAKGSAVPSLSMFAHMNPGSAGSAILAAISGFYGTTPSVDKGPSLCFGEGISTGGSDFRRMGVSGSSTSDVDNQESGQTAATIVGYSRLLGYYWSQAGASPVPGGRPLTMTNGQQPHNGDADPLDTLWNDTTNLRIGKTGTGALPFDGEFDFAMICTNDVTEAMLTTLHEALVANSVATVTNPVMNYFVGDSMTLGLTGGVNAMDSRTEQMVLQDSGWRGMYARQKSQSGQPVEVQETFYADAKANLLKMPSWDRWATFWGGYNIGLATWQNETLRDAILQRYLDMAEDAAQNGISSIHWSKIQGYDSADPPTAPEEAADLALHDDWNDKYRAGIEALQDAYPNVRILWYDHRLTFSAGEFDGSSRTAGYFVDSRHLSASGQTAMVADFITYFSGPNFDTAAQAYIDELENNGASLTGSQKEGINTWFCRERAAGTLTNIKHLYPGIFADATLNAINAVDPRTSTAGFVNDVTQGAGFIQSDAGGTPGYFTFGETPAEIGMTTTSAWLCALMVEAGPGITEGVIGARTGGNQEQRIATNSIGNLVGSSAAGDITDFSYTGGAGLITMGHTSAEHFVALRNASSRSKLVTGSGTPGGSVSTHDVFGLCYNTTGTPTALHNEKAAFHAAGLGLTDDEDEATTANLARLYTALTGNSLPA